MTLALLASALFAGLIGGPHCATMCGGFIAALASRDTPRPLLPAHVIVRQQLVYHAGRLGSYMTLGIVFGSVGAAMVGAVDLVPLQQGLYLVANALLLMLAYSVATRAAGFSWLRGAGLAAFGKVLPWALPAVRGSGTGSRLALGAVWGFVPCTLVYSVLPLALFSGGAWQGGALMLAFGLGTLPHLLGIGWVLQRLRRLASGTLVRQCAAATMTAFALVGIYRALYLPGTLASGPFCLVP